MSQSDSQQNEPPLRVPHKFIDPLTHGPRLTRRLELRMKGDWGIANLHRICGWLGAEVIGRGGIGSEHITYSGEGGTDAVDAVLDGKVHTALFVPAGFGKTVFEGKGIMQRSDVSRLRALATFPQDDRMLLAVDAALDVASLADIRRKQPALRISLARDDGVNMAGFAAHRMLEAAGMPKQTIESWGGAFIEGNAPWDIIPKCSSGEANAVLFEAIMTPYWHHLFAERQMRLIPFDDAVLGQLEARYGWTRGTVDSGRWKQIDQTVETLDFSDFLLLCRDDLPSDLAHLIAWCAVETRANLESQYRHIPPKQSSVTYPLQPARMARTSLPLHEGAHQFYAQAGLL